jgi:membrane protein required for colicin V production
VITQVSWPDILIGAIVLFGALRGFRRGFVAELSGAIALFVAVVAAFRYQGDWDAWTTSVTHLGPGSAHVVAMTLFAFAAYLITCAIGLLLGRVAKLPIVGLLNGALGAGVGAAKAAMLLWAVLYVALFFPLSKDLRADLHRSTLVALLTGPNPQLDGTMRSSLPWFVRPFSGSLFDRHRV